MFFNQKILLFYAFVTYSNTDCYKLAFIKVLSKGSKGRQLEVKRASIESLFGIFQKLKEYVLELQLWKISDKLQSRNKLLYKKLLCQELLKMSYLVYLFMLLYNSIFVILLSGGQKFGVKIISSHSLQMRMQDYRQQQDVPHVILQPMFHHYILGRKHLLVEEQQLSL